MRNRETRPGHGRGCNDPGCSEPACNGPAPLQRPRFFAGQLLTERDLNALQDYLRAKSRLQNRHLHGSGVVCGLEVTCHACDGWITVHPGYAIDPCGEDVVVGALAEFDLIGHIKRCRREARRNCTPAMPYAKLDASDEETWCVRLHYAEVESQPVKPLRSSRTARSAEGCDRGCDPPRRAVETGCEPTRILESFRLDACPAEDCGSDEPNRIEACVRDVLGRLATLPAALEAASDPYRRLRRFVRDLFADDPLNTRCGVLQRFPESAPTDPAQAVVVFRELIFLLVQRVIDCVCTRILPKCPPADPDPPVILACVRVAGDQIVDICNYSCRPLAGAFPNLTWNLLMPCLRPIIEALCCGALGRLLMPTTNDPGPGAAAMEAPQALRMPPIAGLASMVMGRLDRLRAELNPDTIRARAEDAEVNLMTLLGMTVPRAERALGERFVRAEVLPIDDRRPLGALTASPFLKAGERVILYVRDDQVVDWRRYDVRDELADTQARLQALEARLAALEA